ncbi:hypothetical protein EGM70_05535 [Enterobacteriaceae bacterium 89]|nr:hypothetical protein [Enterobacteriaceae bacterium 89]
MTSLHKINQAHLEFDFNGFADAEAFESQAARWVTQHLLPVVETVFDEVCPEHQTLVIDTLTIDLGSLSAKTFYTQAPEKLKRLLQERLRTQLQIATRKLSDTESPEMTVLSQQQQRWKVLWQFLSTGLLPWSVPGEQPLEALGLTEMLTEHADQLARALDHARYPEQILRRLIEQFPATQLVALFPSLTSAQQWQIMLLLLAQPKSDSAELAGLLTHAWLTRFTQLLAQHNLAPLRPHWQKIIDRFAQPLIKALYQRYNDSQLPGYLLRELTEDERLLLLGVLAPQEYPFLKAVLRTPALWQMNDPPDINSSEEHSKLLPQGQIHQQLWLFTLQYLLVDRGSAFNRQSYMTGLVIRMANSQNQTAEDLLASLIAALDSTAIDSTLRGQLLDLLYTIQPVITSSAPETPNVSAQVIPPQDAESPASEEQLLHLNELVLALCSGPESQLIRYWPRDNQPFAALLRWCGQLDYIRRHWSETYSTKILLALAEVLEPAATRLIRRRVVDMDRATVSQLWRWTFAFLIVENSSGTWNGKNYLHYLYQQNSAWHQISYPKLHQSSLSSSLVSGLNANQLADIENIISTLKSADSSQWKRHLKLWQRDYGRALPLIIADSGRSDSVIKRWVAHFDDSALSTLTAIMSPQAAETVHEIISEQQTLGVITHQTTSNARNALWELTLHYLIGRRGSEFNQYQYLLNITEQLSARYQVKTEVLIQQWLSLSDSRFLWRQKLVDLVDSSQQPSLSAPQLLASLQSASATSALGQQQTALLHHYAASDPQKMAAQLQAWDTQQLARMLTVIQPRLSGRTLALLPLLLTLIRHFKLDPHWFYPLLLSRDCPTTPEKWLQILMRQSGSGSTMPDPVRFAQLRQLVLSSRAVHQPQAERLRWLYSLTPQAQLLQTLRLWLEGTAPAPEQGLLIGLLSHARRQELLPWLQRILTNPRAMQRWLEALSPETHQAILLPTLTSSTLALLALRRAFCQLFDSQKQGEQLFWQTLYRQHWIGGATLSGNALMQNVLTELNQLWLAHSWQAKASPDPSVAGFITLLLPAISSSSQRKALEHIANQADSRQPVKQAWAEYLNHQQPEIKQLTEAIEMQNKDVNKSEGILWKNPQDAAEGIGEPVTIHNAGLVIASVYIPMLFQRLKLTDGRIFVDDSAQHQALFCLQWMTNHSNSAPEYQLLLNKVLCGVPSASAIPQQIALPVGAESLIDALLTAIIAHWRVLGNSSISALQSTFFQREGQLTETPEHWQLNIVPGTFDMLLDRLPWSFQTIKYPWMDKPLFVTWR